MIEGDDPGLDVLAGMSLVFTRDRATLKFGRVSFEDVVTNVFVEMFALEMPHAHLARYLMAQHGLDVVFADRLGEWRELYTFSSVRWGRIAPTLVEIDEAAERPIVELKAEPAAD